MKTELQGKYIAEMNQHIRDGINQWADIMLFADADRWAYKLNYFPRDIANAVMIFMHVCSNVGIKNGHIQNEQVAEAYGKRLRQLVTDMTGYDPTEIVKTQYESDE